MRTIPPSARCAPARVIRRGSVTAGAVLFALAAGCVNPEKNESSAWPTKADREAVWVKPQKRGWFDRESPKNDALVQPAASAAPKREPLFKWPFALKKDAPESAAVPAGAAAKADETAQAKGDAARSTASADRPEAPATTPPAKKLFDFEPREPGSLWGGRDTDGETWSIRCIAIPGADRYRFAQRYAELLKQVPGLRANLVQVFHDEDVSIVYYGRYARTYDIASDDTDYKPDPRPDLHLLQTLSQETPNGPTWPFRVATLESLPGSDGGNPAWELSRASGAWSLQVAVFYNTKDMNRRKQAAVEYCKLLREQGEEAYYFHGASKSSVTLGAFPRDSIIESTETDPNTGVARARSRIVDERMLSLQRKYPLNLENGHKMYDIVRNAQGEVTQRVERASFPVEIPRGPASASR
ncbi:MAG: hypothetical protein AB7Q17_01585 [Phycisphaerae bacterium]